MVFMKKARFMRRKKFSSKTRFTNALSAPYVRQPELKNVDTSINGEINSSSTVVALNTLAQGTGGYERIGRSIALKSAEVKFYLANNGNLAVGDGIRAALVYDRQPDGVAAVWSDVFSDVNAAGTIASQSWAFPNPANKDRFKILSDFHLAPSPIPTASVPSTLQDQTSSYLTVRYVPLKGLETRYQLSGNVPNSGQLLFMYKGILAATTTAFAYMTGSVRVSYTDV